MNNTISLQRYEKKKYRQVFLPKKAHKYELLAHFRPTILLLRGKEKMMLLKKKDVSLSEKNATLRGNLCSKARNIYSKAWNIYSKTWNRDRP